MESCTCTLAELIERNQIQFTARQKFYLKIKRVIDFVVASCALLLLSPLFLVIAIVIKIESPHEPVIFKQERIGQNNKRFRFYKFRTMKSTAPSEMSTLEFTYANQYITGIGRVLRNTSLDELPQLINVLFGNMSLIGPRPLICNESEVHFLRRYYGVYQVKPGITGLAQVNGRDILDNYDKVRWDREYALNVSFVNDVKILIKTVSAVVCRRGVVDDSEHKKKIKRDYPQLSEEEYERARKFYENYV